MTEDALADSFQNHRRPLLGVAYRMLGSVAEAEDAVQETWLRLSRTPRGEIENLEAWLRTVIARICLDALRQRRARREEALDAHVPDPVVIGRGADPEEEALLGEAVGLALQRVLDELPPAERVAFVLHDVFALPFGDIAPIIERTPAAARQLASRGRRRVQELPPVERDPVRQEGVVQEMLVATRAGDLGAVVRLLAPEVVLRLDGGPGRSRRVAGAPAVAALAVQEGGFRALAASAEPARVNGGAGLLFAPGGRPHAIVGFTVAGGRIREIDVLGDPARLPSLWARLSR